MTYALGPGSLRANVLPMPRIERTVLIDVSTVTDERMCAVADGSYRPGCVKGLRTAMHQALSELFAFMRPTSDPSADYVALFQFVDWTEIQTAYSEYGGAWQGTIRWQFTLWERSTGRNVVAFAEQTRGPWNPDALWRGVVDRIAGAVRGAALYYPPAPAPPAASAVAPGAPSASADDIPPVPSPPAP